MSTVEELRAKLAEAELEERFIAAKEAKERGEIDDEEYRAIKDEFHAARVASREVRQEAAAAAAAAGETLGEPGDAVVSPDTIRTTARTTDLGGTQ